MIPGWAFYIVLPAFVGSFAALELGLLVVAYEMMNLKAEGKYTKAERLYKRACWAGMALLFIFVASLVLIGCHGAQAIEPPA